MARLSGKAKSDPLSARKTAAGTAPKMPRIARIVHRLGRMIPNKELRRFPKDLSSQIDHYVYGTPKR
jgi:hypothetical protein